MRVTALHKETKLVDIADRLFDDLTPETRRIAEAALLKANPELAKPEALRPGAIIQVPKVAGLKGKSPRTEDDPVGQTRETLRKALESYHRLLAGGLDAERKELRTQTALLKQLTEPELLKKLTRLRLRPTRCMSWDRPVLHNRRRGSGRR